MQPSAKLQKPLIANKDYREKKKKKIFKFCNYSADQVFEKVRTHPQMTSASSNFLRVFVREAQKHPVKWWRLITCKDIWPRRHSRIFFPPHLTLEHKKSSDKVASLQQCPGEFSKFTFSNQFILDTSEAISCASKRQSLFIFHSARPENKAHLWWARVMD